MNYHENIMELKHFLPSISFNFPEVLVESFWHQHAPFVFWLMEIHRPQCFVELGLYNGFSYLALCQAAKSLNLDAKGYAIDAWQGDENAAYYGEDVYDVLRKYHDPRYAHFSSLIRTTFDEAVSHFPDHSIDLLHYDGSHDCKDIEHDFELWKNKLSDRSIVLFHNTNVKEKNVSAFRLWEELKQNYSSFEFLHGNGLGVLGFGTTLPNQFKQFLNASRDQG